MKKAIAMIFLLFGLFGCMSIPDSRINYDKDELIVLEGDSYTYEDRIGTVEAQRIDLEFRGFYGTETVFSYTVPEDMIVDMKIELSQTVDKGRFKVVLIDPDNNITVLSNEELVSMNSGKYRIKLVGEHAFGVVDIDITFLNFPRIF